MFGDERILKKNMDYSVLKKLGNTTKKHLIRGYVYDQMVDLKTNRRQVPQKDASRPGDQEVSAFLKWWISIG